jgi:ERCC4-type nuclease
LFVNKGKYYKGTYLNSSCSFFWITESAVQGKIFSLLIPQIFDQFLCIWTQDARKFARVKELLAMNEELKRARKAFEVDEDKLANEY